MILCWVRVYGGKVRDATVLIEILSILAFNSILLALAATTCFNLHVVTRISKSPCIILVLIKRIEMKYCSEVNNKTRRMRPYLIIVENPSSLAEHDVSYAISR